MCKNGTTDDLSMSSSCLVEIAAVGDACTGGTCIHSRFVNGETLRLDIRVIAIWKQLHQACGGEIRPINCVLCVK